LDIYNSTPKRDIFLFSALPEMTKKPENMHYAYYEDEWQL
jgi:hypothetical protein